MPLRLAVVVPNVDAATAHPLAADRSGGERDGHGAGLAAKRRNDRPFVGGNDHGGRLVSGGGGGQDADGRQGPDPSDMPHGIHSFCTLWRSTRAAIGQRERCTPETRGATAAAVVFSVRRAMSRAAMSPFDWPGTTRVAFSRLFPGNPQAPRRSCLWGRVWQRRHDARAAPKFWKTTAATLRGDSVVRGDSANRKGGAENAKGRPIPLPGSFRSGLRPGLGGRPTPWGETTCVKPFPNETSWRILNGSHRCGSVHGSAGVRVFGTGHWGLNSGYASIHFLFALQRHAFPGGWLGRRECGLPFLQGGV